MMEPFRLGMLAGVVLVSGLTAQGAFTVRIKPGTRLEDARQAIRDARQSMRLASNETAVVVLDPGVYIMQRRFELGRGDGGLASGAEVIYRAETPGTVKLRGGHVLSRGCFKPVEGKPGMVAADVSHLLLAAPRAWPDNNEAMPPGPWLYLDGQPLPLARWPNANAANGGWATFTNAIDNGLAGPGAFVFDDPRPATWDLANGVWLAGYWTHDWLDTCVRVGGYDAATRVIRHAVKTSGGVGRGTWGMAQRRFYAVNLFEELDAPGEWWLDREKKRLYWMPVAGAEDKDLVLASFDQTLFQCLKGVRNVRIENLDFEYSHGSVPVLDLVACENVTISNCAFANHAGMAVSIKGWQCTVTDCRIRNIGGTAIRIDGGDRKHLIPGRNLLEKSDIGPYGTFKQTFMPAIHLFGCGNAVRNNVVHNGPYIALWYYGNEHLIAENRFCDVVLQAGDSAAIYSGRDASSQGNIVFGNDISGLGGDSEMGRFRMGIYLDDCDCGDRLIANRVSGAGNGILLGGGNGNACINNRLEHCRVGIHLDSRGVTWKLYKETPDGHTWWHNLNKTFDYRMPPWHVAYPELERMIDDRPRLPWMNAFVGNTFVDCGNMFGFDGITQTVTNEMTLSENAAIEAAAFSSPITLGDASVTMLVSRNKRLRATFAIDPCGRFSWRLERGGKTLVAWSPLGVTLDARDYGRAVIPGHAVIRTDATHVEASIPLRDLATGEAIAHVEVRVGDADVCWRWRIPGSGSRWFVGTLDAWATRAPGEVALDFRDAPAGWGRPAFFRRGDRLTAIAYPDAPRGWRVTGEVVTPWRATALHETEPRISGK